MRIVCPGYRNALDELFRDESASVSRKARKSYGAPVGFNSSQKSTQKLKLSAKNSSRSINKDEDSPAFDLSIPAPTTSLSESLDDVALVHFMLAYIPGSRFEYLPNLYRHNQIGTPLSATVHAASLARLASETGLCNVMDQARLTYTKALFETNAALSDPETATSDAALISVLLLTLFETSVWSGTGFVVNNNSTQQLVDSFLLTLQALSALIV
ncbi:hypothetical protein N0V94_002884 [Neodidymelliopsis sp. IMI 364377]|nr:hypothetical protein N0V94_002884 [Neodidymelliopsis sp. IMI 364377]